MNVYHALNKSQIFYNYCLGIGAIITSLSASVVIAEFLLSRKVRILIGSYKRKFPRNLLNKKFRLARLNGDKVYIFDDRTRQRHWIKTQDTLFDLDFYWDDVISISQAEFDKFQEGPIILTKGIPGA